MSKLREHLIQKGLLVPEVRGNDAELWNRESKSPTLRMDTVGFQVAVRRVRDWFIDGCPEYES